MPRTPRTCPRCGGTDTIPIVWGYPTDEAMRAAQRGEVYIGGCLVSDHDPTWYCKRCDQGFRPARRARKEYQGPWLE